MSKLIGIYIATAKGAEPRAVEEARAVPGLGLEGDRYYQQGGTFSKPGEPDREVTLIEEESIAALSADYEVRILPGQARRNLVTSGIALNHLVGQEFHVGEVQLRGLRLCEPCGHLESLTAAGVERGLVHRGGLRAQVLKEGILRRGDPIRSMNPNS